MSEMRKDYIFKRIKTLGGKYIYDRHTNSVFSVSEEDFKEFEKIEMGEIDPLKSEIFKKYQHYGVLQKNVVEEIKHPATDYLEHYSKNRLADLILQVTQQCNLRCSYCAYSGIYDNRQHSNRKMDFNMAKKAIDFFIKNTAEMNSIHLSFYGGEPLLEIELIKQCVEYIKSLVEGKKITFGMTTNGTLLNEEITKYLYENDFMLSISLDGSKEEHDANRKFVSGKGSFDVIMDNIRRIKTLYPQYASKVSFLTTINPKAKLSCVLEYFSTDDILADNNIIFNPLVTTGLKVNVDYDESFDLIRSYEYLKFLFMLAGKVRKEFVSRLVIESTKQYKQFSKTLKKHYELNSTCHPGGPCLPGIKRLFVTVDGKFFPCEKVTEASEYFSIGSIDKGFSLDKMKTLINNGTITEGECKSCWNLSNCMICSSQVEIEKDECTICKYSKVEKCNKEKIRVYSELYEICVLREFGYDLVQEGEVV